ncbi:MAG: T9SS C-terminal target domain-containing protein, partial [Flavobacteriia bacterium]|nr:T9SS C-terminal target domain-containing protein [Flavobacteriia bacterium]
WTTTPGTAYQWYVNGQIMQGETNDTLVIPMDFGGNFSVSVYSPNGCDTSAFITLQGQIEVLPLAWNVTYSAAQQIIEIHVEKTHPVSITLLDIHGRELGNQLSDHGTTTFPCNHLNPGIYFVRVGNQSAKRIFVY